MNPATLLSLDPTFGTDSEFEDSDYCSLSEAEATTMSLLSGCTKFSYTYENGRRYHGYKEGKYMIPNDDAERARMELFHHCCLLAFQGELFLAPVGEQWKPQRILDIGTGTGIWAIDIADRYPDAEIIGVDLSPVKPEWAPPNVTFEVDDIEDVWPYPDSSFDLIYIRHMSNVIYDWPNLCRQSFKALKPGGWIEVVDFGDWFSSDDNSIPPNSSFLKYTEICRKALRTPLNGEVIVPMDVTKNLQNIGCTDVYEMLVKMPFGRWPKEQCMKELGELWTQHCSGGLEAYALAPFTRKLGWEKKAVDEFLVEVNKDMRNPKYHGYSTMYCVYGRRPCA